MGLVLTEDQKEMFTEKMSNLGIRVDYGLFARSIRVVWKNFDVELTNPREFNLFCEAMALGIEVAMEKLDD